MKMRSIRRSSRTSTIAQTQRSEAAADQHSDAFAVLDEATYENEGKKCEIHMYERRFNSRGEAILLQSGRRSEISWATESSIEAALVLIRYYSIHKVLETTQLEIRSPYMREALKQVIRSYPGININSSGPILIPNDPMCLFHYRDELHTYASKTRDKKAKEHIMFLLQYMTKVLDREIISYEELMQNEDVPPGLEFQNLWMAFKPGTILYLQGVGSLYRLRDMRKMKPFQQPEYWHLDTEQIGYDGKNFRFAGNKILIAKYDGYRPLTELEVFPLEYHEDQKSIRATLLERGKKYTSLSGIHHCTYNGMAEMVGAYGRGAQYSMIQDRIILDTKEFMDDVIDPKHKFSFIPGSEVIRPELNEHLQMSDEELLICAFNMPAFALTTKRWGVFNVSNMRPVEYNKNAFSSLVLPEHLKKTLASLVKLQDSDSSQFDDLIEGKGKGLIVLLHGPPGVGKTFTAESIADYSERPLYSLGKADFSGLTFPSDKSLSAALARASKWNSIVLLDEADVFMQERSANEMFRNEQVSVLLRILEYFEGTMILTTNRVQTLDAAFKSRIHLSLTYPSLSAKSRSGLWETFILKGTKKQRPRWLDTKFLKKISEEEVNGREIKNIVRVAHALATNEMRALRAKDILQGLQYLKDFERDFSNAVGKRKIVESKESALAKRIRLDNRDAYDEEEQEENETRLQVEEEVSCDEMPGGETA